MKRRRKVGVVALAALAVVLVAGCIGDDTRGWGAPVVVEETQVVSSRKGKLDGVDMRSQPPPSWTGVLTLPLAERDTRLLSVSVSPTDTPYQGDLLRIGSEIVRVRSLTINGAEREMHLDRGFAGTVASPHAVGTEIEAFRRPWRFPDDWHVRQGSARNLRGVYGAPVQDADRVMYVGDYGGWVYAFQPDDVNRDAAVNEDKPDTAVVDVGDKVIGGIVLDEDAGLLYATAGNRVVAISTARMKAALAAGGGVVQPEPAFGFLAGDDFWGAPTLADGILYVASLDGHLYALDGQTSALIWDFDEGRSLATQPVVTDGLVLVGGFDSMMLAVDRATGELVWEYRVNNWIFATPVVEDGTVYFGDFDGILHAVDAETGEPQWSIPLGRGEIRAGVGITGDVLVVATVEGWLIGVDLTSRERIWQQNVGSDILADLVPAGDEVLIAPQGCVTLPGGQVSTYYRAVEAETGTLRRAEGVC